jgi:hypothetical protein
MNDTTDSRLRDLWTLRDFLRDNPSGFTTVTRTKIRQLERELRDEGINTETRPVHAERTRWVISRARAGTIWEALKRHTPIAIATSASSILASSARPPRKRSSGCDAAASAAEASRLRRLWSVSA